VNFFDNFIRGVTESLSVVDKGGGVKKLPKNCWHS